VANSILLRPEHEHDGGQNTDECGEMVPSDFFAEIKNGEYAKHRQRDDFLDDFQLCD
jgi:hypothetical protein